MSSEEKDFSYLKEIISKMNRGDDRSSYDHFDYEEWDKDRQYVQGIFDEFKRTRQGDLGDSPSYVAPGVNLITWIPPFSTDPYFQKEGHSLSLQYRVANWYKLVYKDPEDRKVFALVQVKDLSTERIAYQLKDVAENLYEMVKPTVSRRILNVFVK